MLSEFINHQLQVVSLFGDNSIITFLVLCLVVIFLLYYKHKYSALLVVFTLSSYIYALALKAIYRFSRPVTADSSKFILSDVYGFPSSHVLVYTVFWGFILYFTFKYIKKFKYLMHVTRVLAIYMLLTVGVSRVYLGYHYLRDVLGGYAFGLIFLAGIIYLDKRYGKVTSKNNKKN